MTCNDTVEVILSDWPDTGAEQKSQKYAGYVLCSSTLLCKELLLMKLTI